MKYYQSPRWSAEALYCPNPLAFDQYSNCAHECIYCFSQYQRLLIRGKGRQDYIKHKAKPVNIDKVKRIFLNKRKTQFFDYIKGKKILQWGSLSDPFCPFEKKYKVGLELLKFFRDIDYPIIFGTKGTWWVNDDRYSDLFKNNKNWDVRLPIISLNQRVINKLERGSSSIRDRLDAIEKMRKLNIGNITLRIRPFIFGITDLDYEEIIKEGINRGAKSVSIGFFCHDYRMASAHLTALNLLTGFDQNEFYKTYSANRGCPMRLNRNIKRHIINRAEDLCKKYGVFFSVGDRHFKERSHADTSKKRTKYCKGQFAQASIICRERGFVKWEDISWDLDHFKNVKTHLFNEKCEITSKFYDFTLSDYFKYLWNNPRESRSPYKIFEGIMVPFDKDSNGNLIYKYDKERE